MLKGVLVVHKMEDKCSVLRLSKDVLHLILVEYADGSDALAFMCTCHRINSMVSKLEKVMI